MKIEPEEAERSGASQEDIESLKKNKNRKECELNSIKRNNTTRVTWILLLRKKRKSTMKIDTGRASRHTSKRMYGRQRTQGFQN